MSSTMQCASDAGGGPPCSAALALEDCGIVVIGRNEADRLGRCLGSLPTGVPVQYVDSGSTDRSVDIAASLHVAVLRLDDRLPFSAARARNEGFEALLARHPDIGAVFFIDGDCELIAGFLETALPVLNNQPDCAIVVGVVEETNAKSNVYGLLAGLEWSSPGPGEIRDFGQLGGIMLVRSADFRSVRGFDPSFIAGEDSEFGIRLFLAGRKTQRIAAGMVRHAMEMQRFGQWWRRSVRAGHALGHRYAVHGRSPLADSRSAVRSTAAYGMVLPATALVGISLIGLWGALPLMGYPFLASRFFGYYRRKGAEPGVAAIGALFGVLAKLANAQGLIRFHIQRMRGTFRMIEYK